MEIDAGIKDNEIRKPFKTPDVKYEIDFAEGVLTWERINHTRVK